jgi:signal transduction histidine kinase
VKENAKTSRWSRRYGTALLRHLRQGTAASLLPARKLGHQAVAIGMETLAVAMVHARALSEFSKPACSARAPARKTTGRAKKFFAEAVVAIEQTHGPAVQADARENELTQKLRRRSREASAAARQVKRDVIRRKAAEAALRKSLQHRAKLLAETQRLQRHLRHLMRRSLSTQEAERKETSRQLRDEIAQTLLAIHVRLLGLNQAARSGKLMKKEVDAMQGLMKEFPQMLDLLTLTVGGDHET